MVAIASLADRICKELHHHLDGDRKDAKKDEDSYKGQLATSTTASPTLGVYEVLYVRNPRNAASRRG